MIGLPDIVGLIGVTLLIITYAMLQFDRIDPKGFWYSFNLASMVIEVFWFGLSVYGIWNYYRKRK